MVRADASLVFGEGSYDLASEAGTGKIQMYFKDGASATANSKQISDFGWGVWDTTDYLSTTIVNMNRTQGLYASNAYTTGQWYPFLYIPGLFLVNHRYDIVVNFSTNMGYVSAGNGVYTNRGSDYVYNENKSDYASNYMQFRYSFFCKKDFYGLMIGNGARWGSYPMDGKGKVYAQNVSIYCRDLNKNSDITAAINGTTNAVVSQGEATRQTIENQYDASGTADMGRNIEGVTNDVSGALGGIDDEVGGLKDIFSGTPPPAQVAFPAFSIMGNRCGALKCTSSHNWRAKWVH